MWKYKKGAKMAIDMPVKLFKKFEIFNLCTSIEVLLIITILHRENHFARFTDNTIFVLNFIKQCVVGFPF